MQHIFSFCLLVVASHAAVFREGRSASKKFVALLQRSRRDIKCSNGADPGQNVVRGRYYYECDQTGYLFPRGCISDDKKQVPVGGTFNSSSYEMRCQMTANLNLEIVQSGCYDFERRVPPGGTWQNLKFWYTCVQSADYISIQVSGCVVNGSRLQIGERTIKNKQVFECQKKPDGNTALCAVGCAVGTQTYEIGQEFQDDIAAYTCGLKGQICCPIAIACLDDNKKRVPSGQTFQHAGSSILCNIVDGQVKTEVRGCVSPDGQSKQTGETWTVGQVVFSCSSVNGTVAAQPIRCEYLGPPAQSVNIGCVTMIGPQLVGCRKKDDGTASLEVFGADRLDLALQYHLKYC